MEAQKRLFVVQKHNARNLHYDFRLEVNGVLKSWAVPKGPSLNPLHKRLAVEVEDHRLEYADFEGEIEEGLYGAGRVIIWDKGFYELPSLDQDGAGDQVEQSLSKGFLEFTLFGQKLKGAWALIKVKARKRDWLLIKKKDEYASKGQEITDLLPLSVVSRKAV